MRIISGILLLIFLSVLFIFAMYNLDPIEVRFLTWRLVGLPKAAVIAGAYLLGMLSGWSVLGFFRTSLRRVRERPE